MDRNRLLSIVRYGQPQVALRKESVDRNTSQGSIRVMDRKSLSARRAWIEIRYFALNIRPLSRRSPQGERG